MTIRLLLTITVLTITFTQFICTYTIWRRHTRARTYQVTRLILRYWFTLLLLPAAKNVSYRSWMNWRQAYCDVSYSVCGRWLCEDKPCSFNRNHVSFNTLIDTARDFFYRKETISLVVAISTFIVQNLSYEWQGKGICTKLLPYVFPLITVETETVWGTLLICLPCQKLKDFKIKSLLSNRM